MTTPSICLLNHINRRVRVETVDGIEYNGVLIHVDAHSNVTLNIDGELTLLKGELIMFITLLSE